MLNKVNDLLAFYWHIYDYVTVSFTVVDDTFLVSIPRPKVTSSPYIDHISLLLIPLTKNIG